MTTKPTRLQEIEARMAAFTGRYDDDSPSMTEMTKLRIERAGYLACQEDMADVMEAASRLKTWETMAVYTLRDRLAALQSALARHAKEGAK